MNKATNFRYKAVISSMFVVAIMCLASTAVPMTNGSQINKIIISNDSDSKIEDPYNYWSDYKVCLEFWKYMANSNNYEDWWVIQNWIYYGHNDNVFTSPFAIINYMFIFAAIIAKLSSPDSITLMAWTVLVESFGLDIVLLMYNIFCNNRYNLIERYKSLDLIVNILDRDGNPVNGYEGIPNFLSRDANTWPLEDYGLSVVEDFNFTLANMSSDGWYRLKQRTIPIYLKPPVPPGDYNVSIPPHGIYGRYSDITPDYDNNQNMYIIELNRIPDIPDKPYSNNDTFIKNEYYKFSTYGIDPDGDDLYHEFYIIHNNSDELNPVSTQRVQSGENGFINISFDEIGKYELYVISKDIYDDCSNPSSSLYIDVIKPPQ